ncbi:meiosis-specific nuclear structural protein 1-like [Plodia interpunctella]|uniref:meiosis-specific nuclear structural protein 1-like n=1 Tax=Plodia interpunctella TaxID=58824 RepID=UPI00236752DC|nr:meiosis-specific nuclear structural protein 1-like [Plodia interpunctella]
MEAKTELEKNAVATARRKDLEFIQRAMDIQWLNSRMEDGRMGRCLALIQREAEMEKDFQERTDHAAIVNARAEKETRLGIEIAKVEREEANKLLRRHYLWERDPGLRELVRKLQAGYTCRDLKQQMLHNEYKRLQEKAEEKYVNSVLSHAIASDEVAREMAEKRKIEQNTKHTKELQQQLVDRQRVKQCQYEDTLIEKKMLDDIMRTMADEDQKELQHKREQTAKLRQEMFSSAAARLAWRDKQKQMVIIEERQIEEQKKAVSDRMSSIIEARNEKMRQKEELNAKIAAKILADEAERADRENIIKLLQEQEYLEKNYQDDLAEARKLERVREDTKTSLTTQMENKKKTAAEQRIREAEFRKQSEAKMAADDEKEREKERKKKEKSKQYSQELLKQIEENARRRKIEAELEHQRAVHVFKCHEEWSKEVKEERKKIIEEHAPHLLGYLQAGVLKKDDLSVVSRGCAQLGLDARALAPAPRALQRSKCNAQCIVLREY